LYIDALKTQDSTGLFSDTETKSDNIGQESGFASILLQFLTPQQQNSFDQLSSSLLSSKKNSALNYSKKQKLNKESLSSASRNSQSPVNTNGISNKSSGTTQKTSVAFNKSTQLKVAEQKREQADSSNEITQADSKSESNKAEEINTKDPESESAGESEIPEDLIQGLLNSEDFLKICEQLENLDPKAVLEALRQNEETGELWNALDDKTALKVISTLIEKMKNENKTENPDENLPEFKPSDNNGKSSSTKEHITKSKTSEDNLATENSSSTNSTEKSITDHESANQKEKAENRKKDTVDFTSLQSTEIKEGDSSKSASSKNTPASDLLLLLQPESADTTISSQVQLEKSNLLRQIIDKSSHGEELTALKGEKTSTNFQNQPKFGGDFQSQSKFQKLESSSSKNSQDVVKPLLFSQIIEKAEFFKGTNNQKSLTIQLKPESLGKLNIELISKDGTVTARIFTDNDTVREKLEQIAPQIKEHLAQEGICLNQISVDISTQLPDERRREANKDNSGFSRNSANNSESTSEPSLDVLPAIRNIATNIQRVDITI